MAENRQSEIDDYSDDFSEEAMPIDDSAKSPQVTQKKTK